MRFFLLLPLLFLLGTDLRAQAADDCPCCTPAHRAFDFWIGDWTVTDTSGTVVGHNRIARAEAGCALTESWRSSQGGTGSSVNYYDRRDSSWYQTWIDAGGNALRLRGGPGSYAAGRMVLESEPQTGRTGARYRNRITWTLRPDATVVQHWEIVAEFGDSTRTAFYGIYTRDGED